MKKIIALSLLVITGYGWAHTKGHFLIDNNNIILAASIESNENRDFQFSDKIINQDMAEVLPFLASAGRDFPIALERAAINNQITGFGYDFEGVEVSMVIYPLNDGNNMHYFVIVTSGQYNEYPEGA